MAMTMTYDVVMFLDRLSNYFIALPPYKYYLLDNCHARSLTITSKQSAQPPQLN